MTTSRLLAAALLLVGLVLAPGYVDNVDSRIILRTSERLIDAGTWGLDDVADARLALPEYGARGPHGEFEMKFGAGNALAAVPFVVAGRAVLGAAGLPREQAGEAGASLASALWFAAAGLLVFRLARRIAGKRAGVVSALAYSLGTYAVVYGKSAYLETPLTCAVLLAFDAALRLRDGEDGRGAAVALGAACVAVLWIKLAACVPLLGIVPILWTGSIPRTARRLVPAAAVLLAGAVLLGALNFVRFGDAFSTGYSSSARFDHPFWLGVAELLGSSRGGIFVYCPLLLLAVPGTALLVRRDVAMAAGVWLAFAASLALYAPFFSPFGGDAWGPRYLMPNCALLAVPAGVALCAWLTADGVRRGAACGIVAFSVALQVPPVLVSFQEIHGMLRDAPQTATDLPGPQRLAARIVTEKARGDAVGYDLARLGVGAGRHVPGRVERGWNLWPVRVAQDRPSLAVAAWTAWWTALAACAASAVLLRRGWDGGRA